MAGGVGVTIDPEFKTLIPALDDEEREQLMANILRDGVRDAFVVWQETGILLDGHNRHEICLDNSLEFPPPIELSFACRADAKIWVCKNQLGRRNLSLFARAELALAMEAAFAERGKKNQKAGGKTAGVGRPKGFLNSGNPIEPVKTDKELSRIAGVGHDTIAKVKRIIRDAPEDVRQKLRSGETTVNAEYQRCCGTKTKGATKQQQPAEREFDESARLNRMRKYCEREFLEWPKPRRKLFLNQWRQAANMLDDPNFLNADSI